MGWIEFYSQGEFTGDEDTQGYVMRVSLYGIVSLALPVLLLIAARVVGCTGKISLQSRWALGFFLLPAIGMLAWATVVTATASPVENVNLAVEPLQDWGSEAITLIGNVRDNLQSVVGGASSSACNGIAAAKAQAEAALEDIQLLYDDASKLNNELNDFSLDSYANYDDHVNLYGPIGIGVGIILPIFCLAVLWPLHQRKTISSWPATTAIVFAIVASVLLWILSTAFIPATVAYSDACNSIDTVVKRVADEPSLTFYIDCNPTTNAIFGDFEGHLTDASTAAANAKIGIQTNDDNCDEDLSFLVTKLDDVIAKIDNEATTLLSCGELNTLYTNSKGIVCGDETYTVVLHLHQAFMGASAFVLLFWASLIVTESSEYKEVPSKGVPFI